MVHLVRQSLLNFWPLDLDDSSTSPSMFSTILPSIFSCLGEYLYPQSPLNSGELHNILWVIWAICDLSQLLVVQQGLVCRFLIVSSLFCLLGRTSGLQDFINLSGTLIACPWLHLKRSHFWYYQVRKIRWILLTRPNCHLQTLYKTTIVWYSWVSSFFNHVWKEFRSWIVEIFTLKTLETMMCNN